MWLCGKYSLKIEGVSLMGDTLNRRKDTLDLKTHYRSQNY